MSDEDKEPTPAATFRANNNDGERVATSFDSPRQKPGEDEKKKPFRLEEEEDIVLWMSQHQALCNGSASSWKGRNNKLDLVRVKANELRCSFRLLIKWMNTQGNYYTKLTREKSGQAVKFLTYRQQ